LKSGAGLFGVAAGSNIRLFVINTDLANSILSATYDGTAWTPWSTVSGTETGQHARNFISGYPIAAANQIGLIWTEETTQRDVFATSIRLTPPDSTPPSVSILAPADGSNVFGAVSITVNASDNVGVTGVQFQIDRVNLGSPQITSPYGLTWDSTTVPNGSHSIGAIAADAAGNTSSAIVTVTVSNAPRITALSPASGLWERL